MFKVSKKVLGIIIAVIFSSSTAVSVSYGQSTDALITHPASSIQLVDDLKYLTKIIGGRPTGSSAMDTAMQWSLQRFIAAGLDNAHLDAYTAELNWQANIEAGQLIVKDTNQISKLKIAAMPFSKSTSTNGLQAQIYAVNSLDAADIIMHADKIKGRWLLVPTTPMQTVDDLFNEYLVTPSIFNAAQKAGAVGVLWMSNREGRLLYRHNASMNGKQIDLPGALIEREGAEKIIQLLQSGHSVIFQAILNNTLQKNPRNFNVIAEIKGYEKPDEVIVLGAHLDSWDLGQGAQDNGCNAALVIDAARRMIALEKQSYHPRRTIRFALYSGEELGLYGSTFDVTNHLKELDKIKAVVTVDSGSGKISGFSLGGRKDLLALTDKMLEPVNKLGPFTHTTDAFIGTDNYTYLLEGIPTFVANQDVTNYLPSYHAENDRFEIVDIEQLKLNTIITSVLIWNLANTNQIIPPRQSTGEVRELLSATGLQKQMEIFDIWNAFLELEKMGR
jgi:carboxypeptidase Q